VKIAFYFPGALDSLNRGTPIRAHSLYSFLRQHADVRLITTRYFPQSSDEEWIQMPEGLNTFHRVKFLHEALGDWHPDVLYGQTHNAIISTLLAGRRLQVTTCVDLHGLLHAEKPLPWWQKFFIKHGYDFAITKLDAITTVSHTLAEYYRSRCSQIHVLHGGIDINWCNKIAPERVTPVNVPAIVYTGNLNPYQGIDILCTALKMIKDKEWHFLLVSSSQGGERYIEQYGLKDRTTVITGVAHSEVLFRSTV